MDSPRIVEGEITARDRKVAVVAARFNDFIVSSLLKGAVAAWMERGGGVLLSLFGFVSRESRAPLSCRLLRASWPRAAAMTRSLPWAA